MENSAAGRQSGSCVSMTPRIKRKHLRNKKKLNSDVLLNKGKSQKCNGINFLPHLPLAKLWQVYLK